MIKKLLVLAIVSVGLSFTYAQDAPAEAKCPKAECKCEAGKCACPVKEGCKESCKKTGEEAKKCAEAKSCKAQKCGKAKKADKAAEAAKAE